MEKQLKQLPTVWDGKKCIIELKNADYQWRQMEWWAWFYEFKVKQLLANIASIPGKKYENVEFDLKRSINWDLKASAIKSGSHKIILNDKQAMETSCMEFGRHGEIIALCDVEYDDADKSFQKWHTALKGRQSKYEIDRKKRTSQSTKRKTKAIVTEILFITFSLKDFKELLIMKQGRNSNGKPRPPKYLFDVNKVHLFEHHKMQL